MKNYLIIIIKSRPIFKNQKVRLLYIVDLEKEVLLIKDTLKEQEFII